MAEVLVISRPLDNDNPILPNYAEMSRLASVEALIRGVLDNAQWVLSARERRQPEELEPEALSQISNCQLIICDTHTQDEDTHKEIFQVKLKKVERWDPTYNVDEQLATFTEIKSVAVKVAKSIDPKKTYLYVYASESVEDIAA